MVAMLGGPPESAFLRGGPAQERETKLKDTARLVAAMREVAVKGAGDAEFPDKEHERAEQQRTAINAGPEHRETREMKPDKKEAGDGDMKAVVVRQHRRLPCLGWDGNTFRKK